MNNQYSESIIRFANDLKNQIKMNLSTQRKDELQLLKSQSENLSLSQIQESIEEIEANYKKQISKLDKIDLLIENNDVAALQQIKNVYELVIASNVKQARKDASIVTLIYLSTLDDLSVSSLTTDEAYLLCNAMITIPTIGFHSNERVIANPIILDSVIAKTTNLPEQLDILWEVSDYCCENTDDNMSIEAYTRAIKDCSKIIFCHNISKTQNSDAAQR